MKDVKEGDCLNYIMTVGHSVVKDVKKCECLMKHYTCWT